MIFSAFTGKSLIPSSYPAGIEVSFSFSSTGSVLTHNCLNAFSSLHNAVTQTGSMFSIGTAFTWLPVSYLPAKWRRRNTIKTFFPFAFLSPGTKEVTIRTVRRLITCIPYFCHLPAPFLLSACYTVHRIPFQLLCSSIKQTHMSW